jgi:hypothetical protein
MQGNLVVDMLESSRVDPARKLQLEVVLGKILGELNKTRGRRDGVFLISRPYRRSMEL